MRYSVCEDNDAPRSTYIIWISKRFVFSRYLFSKSFSNCFRGLAVSRWGEFELCPYSNQGRIQEFLKEGVHLGAVIYSITNFLFSNEII